MRIVRFSKAGAKVLLFFDMTKFFLKKMQKSAIFLYFRPFGGFIESLKHRSIVGQYMLLFRPSFHHESIFDQCRPLWRP